MHALCVVRDEVSQCLGVIDAGGAWLSEGLAVWNLPIRLRAVVQDG